MRGHARFDTFWDASRTAWGINSLSVGELSDLSKSGEELGHAFLQFLALTPQFLYLMLMFQ